MISGAIWDNMMVRLNTSNPRHLSISSFSHRHHHARFRKIIPTFHSHTRFLHICIFAHFRPSIFGFGDILLVSFRCISLYISYRVYLFVFIIRHHPSSSSKNETHQFRHHQTRRTGSGECPSSGVYTTHNDNHHSTTIQHCH